MQTRGVVNPFKTAAPFCGQNTRIVSSLSPKTGLQTRGQLFAGRFTGHDPTRMESQGKIEISRVESSRVGSGQGSGGFQTPTGRVGSSRPHPAQPNLTREIFDPTREQPCSFVLFLRGEVLNRTYGTHKNLYVSLFLLAIFGPIYCGPP